MLAPAMADVQPIEPSLPALPRPAGGGRRRGHRGGRQHGLGRTAPISRTAPPVEAPALTRQKTEIPAPAISRATAEVMEIIESLKQALDQMDEVLELVEVAERQKVADEREMESLRRALRRIHQPRGERRELPPPTA